MSALYHLPLAAAWMDDAMQVVDCSRRCVTLFRSADKSAAEAQACAFVTQALAADTILGDELALATARLVEPGATETFNWKRGDQDFEVGVTADDGDDGRFFVIFRDVSDLRRMEQIQQQARAYLEQVLADIPLGVAVLDDNLRITFINEAGLQQLSAITTRRELIDVIGAQLPGLVPDAGQRWHELAARARNEGRRADGAREHFQLPDAPMEPGSGDAGSGDSDSGDSDSGDRAFDAAAHPLHDRRGQSLGAILVLEDVTDKARLEGEVIRMERLATVGQMVITVNHEINNPLTIITASAQAARLLNRDLDDKTVAKLQMIETQVKRISAVTERLRTMEEVQAGDYINDGPKMIDIHQQAPE